MLIYIHGFNSSPASAKARLLKEKLESLGRGGEFLCPALPHLPSEAMGVLEPAVGALHPASVTLVGSSLGGHYATWLVEKYGFKAVLVNPAVGPHKLLETVLGPQKNLYTGEEYVLTSRHLQELEGYDVAAIARPERYLLLVQTGDEVLDYRKAVEKYRGATQIVIEGGDHGFGNFRDYLDLVLDFAARG